MKSALAIFFGKYGHRSWLVLAGLVVAGVLEFLSIGAVLPLLSVWVGKADATPSLFAGYADRMIAFLGIAREPVSLIILVTGGFVLKFLVNFAALSYAGLARARVTSQLRSMALDAMFNTRWSFLLRQRGGELADLISGQSIRAGHAYSASADYFAALVQVVVYFVVGLLVSLPLALLSLGLGLIANFVLASLVKQSKRAGDRQSRVMAGLTASMTDLYNNLKPVRAMDRQQPLLARAAGQVKELYSALFTQTLMKYALRRGADIIFIVAIGVGLYVAIVYLKLEIGEVAILGLVALRGAATFQQMQNRAQDLAEFEGSYWRSIDTIDALNRHRERSDGKVPEGVQLNRFCFDKVQFSHGDKQVLKDVSFCIRQGTLSVLFGPSGAGKTTIVDLLLGLYEPDSGKVLINEGPLRDCSLPWWRSQIGYVPQEISLLHGSIRDNIILSSELYDDAAVWRALELAGADDFVKECKDGLDSQVGEFGARLSGGQRQRIGLARALVSQPKLLILDEVTSALDPQTEQRICDNVAGLKHQFTIIAVTHSRLWLSVSDQNLVVENGRVTVQSGALK